MMLRPSMYQIISKNESYYSLVIGVAKRAREISEQHVKEKEAAKAAAERRAKTSGDQKIRLDDKTIKMVVLEENPVPHYQNDPERVYGFGFAGKEIKFRIQDGVLMVVRVE